MGNIKDVLEDMNEIEKEIDTELWFYFHDRINNKGIVVNTFSYEKSEPQVNVFVVSNPSSSSWHDDMVQIGLCNCDTQLIEEGG